MPKKKTLAETAAETISQLAGAEKPSGKKKDTAGIVAEKLVETVAAIAGVPEEKPKKKTSKTGAKTAKKPAAKTAKKPAAKTAAKKTEADGAGIKSALPIEYQCKGGSYTGEQIIEKCKADFRKDTKKQVRSIEVRIKGSKAYYTVNGRSEDENGNKYAVDL